MTGRQKTCRLYNGRLFFGLQKALLPLRHATLTELIGGNGVPDAV
jgi:hypothetical protein